MTERVVERRRVQRVRLIEPLRGRVDLNRAFVVDVSLRGLRVAHQVSIGRVGETVSVHAEWDGRPFDVMARIVRTVEFKPAASATAKAVYHSGLEITLVIGVSARTLRDMIEWHVERAFDEQVANARGIPTIAPQSVQTGKAAQLKRHELVNGRWRESATTDPAQPPNGFTVSSDHSPHEVAMLRGAFENAASEDGRALIWRLAQLSISADGVPTRRYVP
jgi:hypothetical protein